MSVVNRAMSIGWFRLQSHPAARQILGSSQWEHLLHDRMATRCNSNLHQHALAFAMYTDDNEDYYPAYSRWGTLGGKKGEMTMHGGLVKPEKRPLNTYAPSFGVFHCPADKGDSLHTDKFPKKIRSCYDGWGNSYLTVWSVETLRI